VNIQLVVFWVVTSCGIVVGGILPHHMTSQPRRSRLKVGALKQVLHLLHTNRHSMYMCMYTHTNT